MTRSLRALMQHIIDFAGLFPPAQLPLDEAIRNYARYRNEPESWMLGRFICPAARLSELSPYVDELFHDGPPITVSALGRGCKDMTDFHAGLDADLQDISGFARRHLDRVTVHVYEVKLPADLLMLDDRNATLAWSEQIAGRINESGLTDLTSFFEPTVGENWRDTIAAAVALLADYRNCFGNAGMKLRCGGLEAAAFPTAEQVERVLEGCRAGRIPLKFTAGLHHPIRHRDAGIGTMVHGYLNVFVAGVLATARGLDEAEIRGIIKEKGARGFMFTDDGLRLRDHQASVAEIELARRSAVMSFGSCSFDEPRDDLRALGLIE